MFSWVFSRFDGSGNFLVIEAERKVGVVEGDQLERVVRSFERDGESVPDLQVLLAEAEQAVGTQAEGALGHDLGGEGGENFTVAERL